MRTTLLFMTLFVPGACVSADALGARETGSVQIHLATPDAASSEAPCGWIYAFDRASGQPDACVYIWPDDSWSLGYEMQPGFYGDERARGVVVQGAASAFPAGVLRDARRLYVTGGVEASLDGQSIGRASN